MDIGLVWDPVRQRADWAADGIVPTGANDGTGGDLTAAVLVSVFTDARAGDDFVLSDGSTNRRGWWGDSFTGDPIGSRLWQLERSKTTTIGTSNTDVLLAARDYIQRSLKWLTDDGWAASVLVETFFAARTVIGARITIRLAGHVGAPAVILTSLPAGQRSP